MKLQNLTQNSKFDFPGIWVQIFVSPESEWFTDSVISFKNKKKSVAEQSYVHFLSSNKTYVWLTGVRPLELSDSTL